MHRTMVLIILIIYLTGYNLSNNYKDTISLVSSVDINLENYSGKWYSEDYTKVTDKDGNSLDYGTELIVNMEEKQIEIFSISKPPANRVAYINSYITIDNSFNGSFTFDDDGWGNKRKGTISFEKNKIYVEINIEYSAEENWTIFTGKKVFLRDK